jgi:hypothetical protein
MSNWTAKIPGSTHKRMLPRRWLDVTGNIISDVWRAAQQAVIGNIFFRAGVTTVRFFHYTTVI